jgi:hypothetical protein
MSCNVRYLFGYATEPDESCRRAVYGRYRCPAVFGNMPATRQAPRHGPAPHGLRIVGAIGRGFWRWSAWFLRKVLAYNLSLRFERTFAME